MDITNRRIDFRALHQTGCFVLPNPWDIGSAKRLQQHGFKALGSTSAGYAWSLGRADRQVSRDEVLHHLRVLAAATDLPVNADFEAGFADRPDGVADNVALAIETGIAGLSIEDYDGSSLYPLSVGAERIRAARAAIDRSGQNVMLIGRAENFFIGQPDLHDTIARLVAYSDAGADCLYAPGVKDLSDIAAVVAAVAPKPVSVLLTGTEMKIAALAAIGVRRVSTGGALAAAAWAGFEQAVAHLSATGNIPTRK